MSCSGKTPIDSVLFRIASLLCGWLMSLNSFAAQQKIVFEKNAGQVASDWQYVVRAPDYNVAIGNESFALQLVKWKPAATDPEQRDLRESQGGQSLNLLFTFLDANPDVHLVSNMQRPQHRIVYAGADEPGAARQVETFDGLSAKGVYDGVDVVYKENAGALRFDFEIAPHYSSQSIRLKVEGAKAIEIDDKGDLLIETALGTLTQYAPVVFQEIAGKRIEVAGSYSLSETNIVAFTVGKYDTSRPLVVDPTIDFSSYLGGSSTDNVTDLKVDQDGNIVVAGRSSSLDFPTVGTLPVGTPTATSSNVFVTKISADGSAILFSSFVGGSLDDVVSALDIDGNGDIVVAGSTESADYPVLNAYDSTFNGGSSSFGNHEIDGFVSKFSGATGELLYSTFLGGSGLDGVTRLGLGRDVIYNMTIDPDTNNVFLVGETTSHDFPATHDFEGRACLNFTILPDAIQFYDVFVTKLSGAGQVLASTCIGNTGSDRGRDIRLLHDSSNIAIAGRTASSAFPITPGAYISDRSLGKPAFVAVINQELTAMVAATYIDLISYPQALRIDSDGNYLVLGFDNSYPPYPAPLPVGAFQREHAIPYQPDDWQLLDENAVLKLNSDLTMRIGATYLGGSNADYAAAMELDRMNRVYVWGNTKSHNYPMEQSIHPSLSPPVGAKGTLSEASGMVANDYESVSNYFDPAPENSFITNVIARSSIDGMGARNQLAYDYFNTGEVIVEDLDSFESDSTSVTKFSYAGVNGFVIGNCGDVNRYYQFDGQGDHLLHSEFSDSSFCTKELLAYSANRPDAIAHDGQTFKLFVVDDQGVFTEETMPALPIVKPSTMIAAGCCGSAMYAGDEMGPDYHVSFSRNNGSLEAVATPLSGESLKTTAMALVDMRTLFGNQLFVGYEGHPIQMFDLNSQQMYTIGRTDTVKTVEFLMVDDSEYQSGVFAWEIDQNGDTILTCYCHSDENNILTYAPGSELNLGQVGNVHAAAGSVVSRNQMFAAQEMNAALVTWRYNMWDGVLSVLSPDLSEMVYSSYLGGQLDDRNYHGMEVSESGVVFVGGYSGGPGFPLVDPLDNTLDGTSDGFYARLDIRDLLDDDNDGVNNDVDNCVVISNDDQRDTNGDDIGNACDADINGDCLVNFLDLLSYRANFFQSGDFDTDNNGDGVTNFLDLLTVRAQFFRPPGPSAAGCD